MYEVKILTHFSAAHNLRNFYGKCENLHGHNWKVEVTCRGDKIDEAGMLLDFGVLKKMTKAIMNDIDHKYLNELEHWKVASPSSESIARYVFDRLNEMMSDSEVMVTRVDCWESENSRASYLGPNA